MRIIAGRFRHRVLLANPGLVTRPITDRVKESLFARIEAWLPDARIADIYSGTGTLGFEALSRGARSVVFIESDRKAQELLRKNVETLKVQGETLCWATDALRSSFRPRNVDSFVPFDLAFFDPPYQMIEDLHPGTPLYRSLERLAKPDVTSPDAWLILRTPEHSVYELPPPWASEWTLTMSNMTIDVCRKRSADREEGPDESPSPSNDLP
ncbi:MAG: RsmD family RNA methyltransferase [Planctomyces sp.]|nr:RsmD family RNA methyltransferase [Planctomyces sp.]